MMTIKHVRDDGTIGNCTARTKPCPYASNPHGNITEELKKESEAMMEKKFNEVTTHTKTPAYSWDSSQSHHPSEAHHFGRHLEAKYPGLTIKTSGCYEDDGFVSVASLAVAPHKRGKGLAKRGLQELTEEADRQGWKLSMTPTSDFGANKDQLTQFVRRFAFVENKGRNKDFMTRNTMIRLPQGK